LNAARCLELQPCGSMVCLRILLVLGLVIVWSQVQIIACILGELVKFIIIYTNYVLYY